MKLLMKYQLPESDIKMLELVRKCLIKHNEIVADPSKVAQVRFKLKMEFITINGFSNDSDF